jgi:hypothetical protein
MREKLGIFLLYKLNKLKLIQFKIIVVFILLNLLYLIILDSNLDRLFLNLELKIFLVMKISSIIENCDRILHFFNTQNPHWFTEEYVIKKGGNPKTLLDTYLAFIDIYTCNYYYCDNINTNYIYKQI